jgi:DNA primase
MKVCLAGYSGVALCGTHLSSEDAFKLSMLYDSIIMWLDNDKPEVLAKANDNANKLRLYNNKVYTNYTDTDPKKYTLDYIRSQVEGISNE